MNSSKAKTFSGGIELFQAVEFGVLSFYDRYTNLEVETKVLYFK
jgi:hypothetical protein